MTFNETLAVIGTSGPDEAAEPYSAAWWQRRTAEELRDIIKRGFSGGQAFHGAVSETERRAREETRRLRDVAAVEAERRRKRRRVIILGAFAATVTIAACAGVWVAV
jgi:hypothetical protein